MASNNWKYATLGSVTSWGSGGTPSKDNPSFWSGDIPWISASSMKTTRLSNSALCITKEGLEDGSRLAEKDSILLLVRGSELHKSIPVGIAKRDVAYNQDVKALKASADLIPEFLLYWLLANEQLLLAKVEHTGIGAGKLDTNILKNLSLPIPPLSEQHAIAAILGALDDKIELNRRMTDALETVARLLFKNRFPDATENKPSEGWHIVTIADLVDFNTWTLGKNDKIDPVEYVEISEVSRGNIRNIQTYNRGDEPSRARRRLRHGDTVLSTVRPDRGAYFLCLNPSPNLIASTGFAVISPTKAPWSFIHAALTQPKLFEYLGLQADGGAYPAIHPEIIGKWEVCIPEKTTVLEAFHQVCAPLFERAEQNRHESRTLAALRDTLLPKLLSGELRVPQTKQVANVVPFLTQPTAKNSKKTTDEFVEAVVIAQLVRKLAKPAYPLGRKRYNKLAYFAHRKAENDVTQHYLKKAAGPYSPWAKYGGPEKIALKNGYIKSAKSGVYEGLVTGEHIAKIDQYLLHYPVCVAIDWVIGKFGFKKNDDLELLATVDFAALDLRGDGNAVTVGGIKHVISANKEWAPKLDRTIFSDANILRALNELRSTYPATYTT